MNLHPVDSVSPIVEALAMPVAVHRGGVIVAANEALTRLCGRPQAELQGMDPMLLLQASDREAVARASRACLSGAGTPPAVSALLLTPQGSARVVEVHSRPLCGPDGIAVLLTIVDLSDLHHVQTSLIGLGEMMRQVVDGAPIASLVIDKEHRVTHWNAACERMTGIQRHLMIGTAQAWRAFYAVERPLLVDLIVDGADEQALRNLYGERGRASATIEGGFEAEAFFSQFGDGGMWLYFTAAPLRDGSGTVVGAIETLQDVTQRRQVEDELRRHRNELERIVQERSAELSRTAHELETFIANSPVAVALSSQGRILRANRAMARMFGYSEEEIVGLPGAAFYPDAQAHAQMGALAGAVLSKGQPLNTEAWMTRSDGAALWVQVDAHVSDPTRTDVGTWWMMQDRTDIRAAQQLLSARLEELQLTNRKLEEAQNQLLQQDKMASIGQLAAGVAHEINNPVGFVGSNLNTLRQYIDGLLQLVAAMDLCLAAPDDAAAIQVLAQLRESLELDYLREDLPVLLDECADGLGRVRKIVQDLKDFSRVDQSDWQDADLNAGLESTLNVVRHEVKYKAEVVRKLVPLPAVNCLAAQLNQVFMNLIVNAVHALPDRGVITLSSGHEGEWAWVQVDDNGCGMTEEVRRRIFEPFFTTKEVGKGTGLGLSLSFSIVKKHGGAMDVLSHPGRGSSFRVWVPVGGPESVVAGHRPPARVWRGPA